MADEAVHLSGFESPAVRAFSITPSDTADLTLLPRALYIGVTGDVSVILIDDDVAVTFVGVLAGSLLPIRAQRVRSTGTTATNIVGIF